ncbi:hypothetical protein TOT_010000399 [Theileria orientalis strain Shintoku]|uniref:Uncharacterized protein n=1 Tax=Theileria orientalis strain Shintoku TaxID=869250 RepID=J4DNG8_THEOR|nr:hypothetical protein TOT_010000399 [Theileria orientalis strain Shintoku]BAM38934.1 hypothetical protein TOT_010000399 [Theileria orientalis strain Shintoku]|eukprot:XP_009689235.1 hypothetical protein TOT_010000399 [Theileria orientalis strain Shintoku]
MAVRHLLGTLIFKPLLTQTSEKTAYACNVLHCKNTVFLNNFRTCLSRSTPGLRRPCTISSLGVPNISMATYQVRNDFRAHNLATHDSLGRNPPPVLTHRRVTYDGVSETVAQFDTQVTRVVNE